MALDAQADAERFATHYRVCPHPMPGPQELRAERTLKAGELKVSWERVNTSKLGPRPLFVETFITVIVDDGSTTTVRQARPTTSQILVDGLSRGRDLEITAAITRRQPLFCAECTRDWHPLPEHEAITRQQHLLSEISYVRLWATQTRSWNRTRSDTEATTVQSVNLPPPPPRPFTLLPPPRSSVAAGYNLSYWIGNNGNLEIEDDIVGKYVGPNPDDRTPPSGMFKAVGMGRYHGCAVLQDTDTVECWGTNSSWRDFTVPQDLGSVTMLNVGEYHNCAVKKEDNTVQCWGDDYWGQASAPSGQFHSVGGGLTHTCGLQLDGQVQCWGANQRALQRGQADVPADLGPFRALATGDYHNCAIRKDDTVACWGWNEFGQANVPPSLATVKSLSAGRFHTCAVTTGNTTTCWGDDRYGQRRSVPSGRGWEEVEAGTVHSCGRKQDGTVECWRLRDLSPPPMTSLGVSTLDSCGLRQNDGFIQCWGDGRIISNAPGRVDGRGVYSAVAYKAFSNGNESMCAIKLDDTLDCWGRRGSFASTQPENLGTVKAISVVEPNACAIKLDDTLVCWGPNDDDATDVPSNLGTVKGVALGGAPSTNFTTLFTCAIKADDSVACWGSNSNGQLTVPSNLTAKLLAAAQFGTFICAIRANNPVDTAVCWGEAGGIPENPHMVPSDLGTVSEISVGLWHVCVLLKPSQTARCWGGNDEGQAGSPKVG